MAIDRIKRFRGFGEDDGTENMPLWGEYFVYGSNFTTLAAGTGMAYTLNEIRIDTDADFQFMKTSYISDNDNAQVFMKYQDDTSGRQLMKRAVDMRLIAGRSLPIDNSGAYDLRPFQWPINYTIRRATTFGVSLANNSNFTPTVRLAFHGAKLRPGIAPWKKPGISKMPYVYTLQQSATTLPDGVVQLSANATITAPISTDKDSHFVCYKLVGSATGDALITIQDGGRDRQWMNTPIHIRNIIGSGAFPNNMAVPRFVSKGSVISVTLQDLSGATNNISVDLVGVKLFGM
jgi:hypothetical protein